MRLLKLSLRGLVFYRHIGLWAGLASALCTAVLCGALLMGDCVRISLYLQVKFRLGQTRMAVIGQKGTFRAALARQIGQSLSVQTAPVLALTGIAENSDGSARAINVQVLGVENSFRKFSLFSYFAGSYLPDDQVAINAALSQRLKVLPGDDIVLRIQKIDGLSAELLIAPQNAPTAGVRWKVAVVADDKRFGNFSLTSSAAPALNVFVPLDRLSRFLYPDENHSRANLILLKDDIKPGMIDNAIRKNIEFKDLGLKISNYSGGLSEVRSENIFLNDYTVGLLLGADGSSRGILTYFVNQIRIGQNSTPYSMVCGIGQKPGGGLFDRLGDDEIILNEWLADDLKAQPGQTVELSYFVPAASGVLKEQSRSFRIAGVIPTIGIGADPTLTPDFPQLSDAQSCLDWRPGIPIDLRKIREKDQRYWDDYRGSPKAFVSLAAARQMWANRFGSLTAVRFTGDNLDAQSLLEKIRASLEPASAGLTFADVRAAAARGASGTTDFAGLFAGLSFFLIISAMILLGLVFAFELERRAAQAGILKAVGIGKWRIAAVFLAEAAAVAVAGSAVGTLAGLGYTKLLLAGLAGIWREAVAGAAIDFFARPSTLAAGFAAGAVIGLLTMAARLPALLRKDAVLLLGGTVPRIDTGSAKTHKYSLVLSAVLVAAAVAVAVIFGRGTSASAAGAFFASGAMLLAGLLLFARYLLFLIASKGTGRLADSIWSLAMRSLTRRPGRSLSVIALLALGVFFVIATGSQGGADRDNAFDRKSGTGGFALWAQSGIGITRDLNEPGYRRELGIGREQAEEFEVVGFRQFEAEQASCLNLNRVSRPTLWAVEPGELARRQTFSFREVLDRQKKKNPWFLLEGQMGQDVIPAIGDWASVYWSLGLKTGDRLEYEDENGRRFYLEIVGMLNNSIFQGGLIISDKNFLLRFPSQTGRRVFLLDCTRDRAEIVSCSLTKALRDYGLEVQPAGQRLAEFMRVERTYLAIFTALGFIGLLFGSAGLGLVVVLNVLERQGELAMLRAMGYQKRRLRTMLFAEHTILLAAGLFCGLAAAAVAVIPSAARTGSSWYGLSALFALIIAANGILWVRLACGVGLRRDLLEPLRNE